MNKSHNQRRIEQLAEMQDKEHKQAFADDLLKNIGVLLANLPLASWPPLCKTAFDHSKRKMQTAAHIYERSLPEQ